MEIKQNQKFFYGKYSNLASFSIGHKKLTYFNDFILGIFQFHYKSEHKQVNCNRIK